MLGGVAKERRIEVDAVIARAGALAVDDYDRLLILRELHEMKPKTVLDAAADLVRVGSPTSMALAAQILFGLYLRIVLSPRATAKYRALVEELCGLGQDPQVLAEALHCLAWAKPAEPRSLLGLLDHWDARVRDSAVQAVVRLDQLCADRSVLSKIIDMLEWDSEPAVRVAAAAGLFGIYRDDPGGQAWIAEVIARFRTDPLAEIRGRAIVAQAAGDADQALEQLLDELAGSDPPWQIVAAFTLLEDLPPASRRLREKASARLKQLEAAGWAERYVPRQFPYPADRSELLAEAVSAVERAEGDEEPASR